ncbi:MAG: type III pantothenate kinase [Bacteroidales bacterium]|nr:type III pantothenate kinase [Bacteroidales bacterium]
MNLIIDIGNTLIKLALFDKNNLVRQKTLPGLSINELIDFIIDPQNINSAILSAVKNYPAALKNYFVDNFYFIELTEETAIPLLNMYQTPETLGRDRIAAATGANHLFPDQHILVVDAGTCITYDYINNKNVFLGGSISPGIDIRFKALHTFTGNLPLVTREEESLLTGNSTQRSILSGVMHGIYAEMEGIIRMYKKNYPDIKVILTGGDVIYFEKRLKNKTFAFPNLVLTGLNIILGYNKKLEK